MNMKKILLALGIGAGVGAACYFAKKKLDEMYYDMCAAPPYVPSPAGPAKRPAATAEKKPTPDAPAAEPVAEQGPPSLSTTICSAVHAQRNSHGPNIGSGAEPALGHGSQQKELTRQFSSLKKIPKSQSPE